VDNKSGQQVKDINFQEGKIKKAPVKTAASSSNGGAEGETAISKPEAFMCQTSSHLDAPCWWQD